MATATKSKRRTRAKGGRKPAGGLGRTMGRMMKQVQDAMPDVKKMLGISVEFQTLNDLFVKELSDLYSAENQLIKALPKMAKACHSAALRKAFEGHLRETEQQAARLQKIFREMQIRPEMHKCKAMAGLIKEGDEWAGKSAEPGVKDAGLIAAAQRVEHYEIAGYGCARTYARLLGHRDAAKLLQATLDEEGSTDKKLTALAERINVQPRDVPKARRRPR
jgi:ferritin-like metal-binding protein YciE